MPLGNAPSTLTTKDFFSFELLNDRELGATEIFRPESGLIVDLYVELGWPTLVTTLVKLKLIV